VRLHVVGVGSAPNRSLTQQVAAAGRGTEVLVETVAQAFEGARRRVAATAKPVLTGVTVSGTALTGLEPGALGDVFAGQPLVFTVELSRAGGSLEVSGDLAGDGGKWLHRITVPARAKATLEGSPLPLGALFGRQRIAELERRGKGERSIERLGLRHQIASSRTSLIAISEEPTVNPKRPTRVERLAVEVPYGVSAEGAGLSYPATMHVDCLSMPRMARTIDEEMPSRMIEAHLPIFEKRSDAMRRTARRMFQPITAHRVEWRSRDELAFVISIALAGRDDAPRVIKLRLHDGRSVSAQLVIVGLAALRRPDDATEMRILLPAGIEVAEFSTCRCINLESGGGFMFDLEIPANRPEQPR
jgi:hypothetical protein